MKLTFWDSNLFIYLIEQVHPYEAQVEQVVSHMRQIQSQLITSSLTVCETLVKPVREQRQDIILQYQTLFESIPIVSIEPSIAPTFAQIRSSGKIKTPDALQLACAFKSGADCFITNDQRLSGFSGQRMLVYSLEDYLTEFKLR